MTRILNAESRGYSNEARAILRSLGEVVDADLDRTGLLDAIPGSDVLIVRLRNRIDEEILDAGSRLEVVVSATTGLDHIDLDAAAARGVEVLSLRGETGFLRSIPATAEHTWALLLALVRRIVPAAGHVRDGGWDRDAFLGHELRGRRLGLVGCGRVGTQVAGFGEAFGMEVAAYDPSGVADGVEAMPSLRTLLARSDALSIHVPLDASTRVLVGAQELAALPAGAVVVNTSRGGILDEEALVTAIRSGHLAGAALDVVEGEDDRAAREAGPLLRFAREDHRLLITPHIAGATEESMRRTEVFMARKLAAYLSRGGGEPVSGPSVR